MPPGYRTQPSREYPLILTTGARKYLYYHSRYRNIKRFRTAVPSGEVEVHPGDARRLGIEDRERVRVVSAIGSIEIEAKIMHED